MTTRAVAYANNDIAYIFWIYSEKIPNCLGFSIRRIDSSGEETPLPAYVGFEPGMPGQPHKMRNTDVWPVQSFQWKDVYAQPGIYKYKVIPMIGPGHLALHTDEANALITEEVEITGDYGAFKAYFNVGLISTQMVTRQLNRLVQDGVYSSKTSALYGEIGREGSSIRTRLAGDVLNKGVLSLFTRAASDGGNCHAALYELTDRQLIEAIESRAASGQLDLCLSNADSSETYTGDDGKRHSCKIKDGTNADTRRELHEKEVPITDRFVPSNCIGHNKFVVLSKDGQPEAVLTGSTNWTATGLCSQTNNALVIENRPLAESYLDYWNELVTDAMQDRAQGNDLRTWCANNSKEVTVDGVGVKVWFSPNTERKTKGEETPSDLEEVFELIRGARKGVLFLAFNPGSPSCLEVVRERAEGMRDLGKPFYVRGAVTDVTPLGQFATFLTKRSALDHPDVLVTGVAGIPDNYGYWEEELFKIGHAVIHDKVLVIDPFTPDCVVITGSHNLGFKASYQNDENLVIVKGHERLAQAYAAHVLDITNHFAWRAKLAQMRRQGRLEKAWGDLDETDSWQTKYFDGTQLASRDAFFFMK